MNQTSKSPTRKSANYLRKIVNVITVVILFIMCTGCEDEDPDITAHFDSDITDVALGEWVSFTTRSRHGAKLEWKFEGGTPATANDRNPHILYNSLGTFNVELTVTTETGKADTIRKNAYITVTTCGPTITDSDGNTYKVVEINGKCWMAENLRTTSYSNGIRIWGGPGFSNWDKYPNHYGGDAASPYWLKYGHLYNHHAATHPHGLCPEGWHVPTRAEFDSMVTYLGGEDVAGGALRTTTGWTEPNTGATNSSGFSALPGGAYSTDGGIHGEGSQGYYMALTSEYIYSYLILYGETGFMYSSELAQKEQVGHSCRCTKD